MKDKIECHKCNSEMEKDGDCLFCPDCGFIISIEWMIAVLNKLEKDIIEDKEE